MYFKGFLVILASLTAPPNTGTGVLFDVHPRVFLTGQEATTIRGRIQSEQWAQDIASEILNEADALVEEDYAAPRQGGQWSHWYTCKADGTRLQGKSPTEHACTKCGAVYSGYPYDEVYISSIHRKWLSGLESLGIAYSLTDDMKYAERARTILLDYSAFYESLDIHNVHGKVSSSGARLLAQTLDESVILCRMCLGYDLLYEAPVFAEEDHETIEQRLLRPMVATIQRNKRGKSNWQSWHNAGVASAGFLLNDPDLISNAIDDPEHGFLVQMDVSVLPSGMWYEGAPSYHWYALTAHVYLLEAAARAGRDLYTLPAVKRMFDAPMRQLFPDMTFPPINDSDRSSIYGAQDLYEVAYRRFHDPAYLAIIRQRTGPWALLWGASLPSGNASSLPPLQTSNDEHEGLAILRDDAARNAVFFNYASQQGGHTHPAKLDLILFGHGNDRIVDPGRLAYGNPLHSGWYRQTIAHNTVVVDQTSQEQTACELIAFVNEPGFAGVRAIARDAYPGVLLDRTILLLRGTIVVDLFRCAASEGRVFDLPLHVRGVLPEFAGAEPVASPGEPGYALLERLHRLAASPEMAEVDCSDGRRLHCSFCDVSEVFVAEGHGPRGDGLLPVVIRRQRGVSAAFAGVYQILDAGQEPAAVSGSALDGLTIEFQSPNPLRIELKAGATVTCAEHPSTDSGVSPRSVDLGTVQP